MRLKRRFATKRFTGDRDGATAIEFAIICPVLIAAVFGAVGLGVAIWSWNILEDVSAETARCVAIRSAICSTIPAGCTDAHGYICYAKTLATARGMPNLQSNQIAVVPSIVVGSLDFTEVTLQKDILVLGLTLTVSATNAFPNNR